MLFSQTVEYALRAMVMLADSPAEAQVTRVIAERTRVPAGYLSKVLQSLGRAGLVKAQRGTGGGWTLARPPEDISILEVVNAVDPIQRITTCPLGLKSHGTSLCPLHHKLDDALRSVEEAFGSTTLADVVGKPGQNKPLCDVTVAGGERRPL
jgi:Rrf2 family transcriptional regulator, nitric oxide-sensitive transcriptional repressor